MANICDNTFYAYSENEENIKYIEKFLVDNLQADCDLYDDSINAYFDSKWTFPEELMDEMFDGLPDKNDIYMRCLSVEYAMDYIDYHKCEGENGWYNAL